MAIGVPLKVKSFFRPKLGKRSRSSNSHPEVEVEIKKRVQPWVTSDGDGDRSGSGNGDGDSDKFATALAATDNDVAVCDEETNPINPQLGSPFFQKLPLEIRRMIYEYTWLSPQDHMFHVPNGRHIHFQEGHWHNVRCVMDEMDEDLGFIQKKMDEIYDLGDEGDNAKLALWQRRSSQTWGHRHWRCEERMRHPREARVDKRNFASVMVVCKRM